MPMTEAAAEARRAYKREWYARNRDKQREYTERYWAKKAAEDEAGKAPETDSKGQETEESGDHDPE